MRSCPTCRTTHFDRDRWARCCAEPIDRGALKRMFDGWELLPATAKITRTGTKVHVPVIACGEVWFGTHRLVDAGPMRHANEAIGEIPWR